MLMFPGCTVILVVYPDGITYNNSYDLFYNMATVMAKATLHKYFVNCFIVVYLSVCLYICVSSLVFLGYDLPKIFCVRGVC